jgi:hypothetical protein
MKSANGFKGTFGPQGEQRLDKGSDTGKPRVVSHSIEDAKRVQAAVRAAAQRILTSSPP